MVCAGIWIPRMSFSNSFAKCKAIRKNPYDFSAGGGSVKAAFDDSADETQVTSLQAD
jgi:hypothetical protein